MPPYGFSSLEYHFFVGQKISKLPKCFLKNILNFGGLLLKIFPSHFRKPDGLSTQELPHKQAHKQAKNRKRSRRTWILEFLELLRF